jgi:hypothetical protein
MALPKKDDIKKVLNKLEKRKRNGEIVSSSTLHRNSSYADKLKYSLCRKLIIFKMERGLSGQDLAIILEVDGPRVSEALHYKINTMSIDILLGYMEKMSKYDKKFEKSIGKILKSFDSVEKKSKAS